MQKLLFIAGAVFVLYCVEIQDTFAGPALDSLNAAAGVDAAILPVVFDGAAQVSPDVMQHKLSYIENVVPAIIINGQPRSAGSAVPSPSREVEDKSEIDGLLVPDNQMAIIKRAMNPLYSTATGGPLARFFDMENVEIRWAGLGHFDMDSSYAGACTPEACGNKRIVYLAGQNVPYPDAGKYKNYQDFFLDNPLFLACVLSHELAHLSDYKTMGNGVAEKSAGELFLELNGWSVETYVYDELAKKDLVPPIWKENAEVQRIRLNLAIRDYVNGGDKPYAGNFPLLSTIDGLDFKSYITEVTRQKRIGSMSLAGVVERAYNIGDISLENPVNPSPWDLSASAEYAKYQKLHESLGKRTAEYIEWRNDSEDGDSNSGGNSGGNGGGSAGNGGSGGHIGNDVDWHDGSKGPGLE